MNVIVMCEFSGIVREAFQNLGHNAWSIDLLETELPGNHIQADILTVDYNFWKQFDIAICHPPCNHLAVSGARWFKDKKEEQYQALKFVEFLMNLPIKKIALENPVSIISTKIRKPDQIIQPWQFGHPESKATCLWLKNLTLLKPTEFAKWDYYRCRCGNVFEAELGKYGCCDNEAKILWNNQTKTGQNCIPPSIDRWKIRSRTYPGIANAMAEQWGNEITKMEE